MSATSSAEFLIYALHHPESQHVYVGQSARGMKRPREHTRHAYFDQYRKYPKSKWIRSLHERGLEPEIVILEECVTAVELDEAERHHIAYFKSMGVPLLNLTDGGDGGAEMSKLYWTRDGAREKKRQERLGQTWDDQTRARMSDAHRGKKKTPETRVNMSVAAERRWEDPNYRAQQIEAQKIAHSSDEARARAAEYAKRASHDTHRTAEYRAKQSARVKVACNTDDVRAARAAATKRMWDDPAYRARVAEARRQMFAEGRGRKKKKAPPCP